MFTKPKESKLPVDIINNSKMHNPDGFGIMYVENERVKSLKGMFTLSEIKAILFNTHTDYMAHFRYATAGTKDFNNCHPFEILNKNQHGIDLYMMHNGTLNIPTPDDKSDTNVFAELLKNTIIDNNFDVFNPSHQKILSDTITDKNKLMFLDSNGRTAIINQHLGIDKDGIWYSNGYSLYEDSYETNAMANWLLENKIITIGDYEKVWKLIEFSSDRNQTVKEIYTESNYV